MNHTGMLHILVGLAASGKSTLAEKLAQDPATVVVSEDAWLAELFGPDMSTLADYVRFSARLRAAMTPHISALLRSGVSVVLDFGANTLESRAWLHDILKDSGCDHVLHFLDVSPETCLARLHARNAAGSHPFAVTDEQFYRITAHFTPPDPTEGFSVRRYTG